MIEKFNKYLQIGKHVLEFVILVLVALFILSVIQYNQQCTRTEEAKTVWQNECTTYVKVLEKNGDKQ